MCILVLRLQVLHRKRARAINHCKLDKALEGENCLVLLLCDATQNLLPKVDL